MAPCFVNVQNYLDLGSEINSWCDCFMGKHILISSGKNALIYVPMTVNTSASSRVNAGTAVASELFVPFLKPFSLREYPFEI